MKPKVTLRHKIICEMPYIFLSFLIKEKILNLVVIEQMLCYYICKDKLVEEKWNKITLETQLTNRFHIFSTAFRPPFFWIYYNDKWLEYLKNAKENNKLLI